MEQEKSENTQKFLNELSREIDNGSLSFTTDEDKFKLYEKLIAMIGKGSQHRDSRIIDLMEKMQRFKPYADPYKLK